MRLKKNAKNEIRKGFDNILNFVLTRVPVKLKRSFAPLQTGNEAKKRR